MMGTALQTPSSMPDRFLRVLAPDDPEVPALVEALGKASAESFFLSRWWLEACLATWPIGAGHRVLAFDGAPLAGRAPDGPSLGLLGARTQRRHGWLRSRVLGLNQSLDEGLDEPTMELNGFFGARGEQRFAGLFGTLLDWLESQRGWDEFRMPGVLASRADAVRAMALRHGLRVRTEKQAETWWIDLEAVRANCSGDYLAALSPNTRQQLRRARRAIEKDVGPLTIAAAGTIGEALTWLEELARLHRSRWAVPGTRSGFDIPSFRSFHRTLVERAFPADGIQMLRIAAGETPIAWLYNLMLDGHVHFVLSGIDFERFERFKPGMLAHWMAIELNLGSGARLYDFLGGSQRYKASLGTHSSTQEWLVLWRPRPGLLLEDWLRAIRRRYFRPANSSTSRSTRLSQALDRA